MLFKELKPNFTTYHLHRGGDKVSVNQGKVTNVSQPRIPTPQNPALPMPGTFAQTATLVVDVTIDENGETKTYTIPETLDVTYAGNDHVIATTREKILSEVEAMKNRADEVINSLHHNEAISDACEEILENWNPAIREKRQTEERMVSMETRIDKVTMMMETLLKKLG